MLMMSGKTRRPDIRRPPQSMARPRSICRVSLPGSGAGPSRQRRGPGPLPTLSMPRWVTGSWRFVASLQPVTTSTPITIAWSMAFRSLGPGKHWAAVGPGSSHHRNAGWKGLLLVTGPGRPAGRLCLCALDAEEVAESALFVKSCFLDNPSSLCLTGGTWNPSSSAWISIESSNSWLFFTALAAAAALHFCFCWTAFSNACHASGNQSLHTSQWASCVQRSPHLGGTADIGSGYRSIFCSESNQETSVAVPWKMTYHVTPPSCLVVNKARLVTKDGIKSNSWPKWRQKRPLPRPTIERCSSHKPTLFQASKMPGKATGTVRVRFTSAHEWGENWSEQQADTVLCAGADAHGSRNVTQFHCFEISPGIG